MAIEGPLRELSIQDVLQLMELARKTGVLTVRGERRGDEAVVHFDRGMIVFAMRRRSSRRLGQQLLRAGKLTERELQRALELQQESPGRRLGEILIEMGSVAPDELERHLRFQVEEVIYDLMSWDEGDFRFEDQPAVDHGSVEIRIRVESLLMEGARRIDEWARLESRIPSVESVPILAPTEDAGAAPLDLHPEEWEVLGEIDGERDLRQIAAALGRSSFDVAKIVFGLVSTGVVQVQERPSRLSAQEFESALQEVARLLSKGEYEAAGRLAAELEARYPEHGALALMEGQAWLGQGRMRAATEAFARAVGLDPLSVAAHYHLGFAAVRIGDFERAARAWETYLRLVPDDERDTAVLRALPALHALKEVLAGEGVASG
ncbi:MAG TPA: DUF4388 domain-containing protein [Longimicrobiales bacterium]